MAMECKELAPLDRAERQLSAVTDFVEALNIRDQAVAAKALFAARRAFGPMQRAVALKLRAERKAGEILAAVVQHGGDRKSSSRDGNLNIESLGINGNQSSRWQALASIPEEQFNAFIAEALAADRELTTKAALALAKKQAASGSPSAPAVHGETGTVQTLDELVASGEKFSTIYADPPWQYGNQATRASTDNHYATLSIDELMDMGEQVKELAENDAHLWLWTTTSFLPDAIPLMAAWGFKYKTNMVWVKPQMGIGNYLRVSHEHLLLGVRGALTTAANDQMSWVSADRTEHSAKPAEFRRIVERLSPGPYLELFGRQEIDGWKVFGNQIPKQLFPV